MENRTESHIVEELKERARRFWEAGPMDFDLEAIERRVRGNRQIGPYETAKDMINQEYAPEIVRDYIKLKNLPKGSAWRILQDAYAYYATLFAEGHLPTPSRMDQFIMARQCTGLAEGFAAGAEEPKTSPPGPARDRKSLKPGKGRS